MFEVHYKKTSQGIYIIDEPIWNNLAGLMDVFNNKINDKEYIASLCVAYKKYLCWLSDYCKDRLGEKTHDTNDVINKVFITTYTKENQLREYVKFSLIPLHLYVEDLKKNANVFVIPNCKTLIRNLYADAEWLIIKHESFFKGVKDLRESNWSRKTLDPHTILFASEQLFHVEELKDIKSISIFNLKPYSIFMIRQLLERLGKNLIGFENIVDKEGKSIHQFTQVSWNFLKQKEKDKRKKWSVELPLRASSIAQINGWTNSFVHTTYFNQCYLQYYALYCMQILMKPVEQSSIFYKPKFNLNFGDFKIQGYHYLQKDFSKYVKEQKNGNAYVLWSPIREVGAYIKSFGFPHFSFIMHMPPPTHGASMMGKVIHDCRIINNNISASYVNIATANSIEDIGKFSIRKVGDFIKLIWKIRRNVLSHKPELVYFTPNAGGGAFLKDFILREELRLLHCHVIAHYHNKGVSRYQGKFLYNLLYKRFFKNLDVILLSNALYDDMKKYVKPEHLFFCANGIESAHPGKVAIRKNPIPKILFLSNLIPSKGVYVLLDALKILNEKHINFECNFVGAETKEINVQVFNAEVNKRCLNGKVKYVGKQYGSDKIRYYDTSDIFVFPTYYTNECFPLVLLEAMDACLPCISTREGAIPDIIEDGETGLLVNKQDANDLADKIEKLVNDPALCNSMGMAGKQKFDDLYTKKNFEDRLFNILAACSAE